MKTDFIKINLLPGFKEDKFVSGVIYQIALIVSVVFVIFYLMYLPYKSAVSERETAGTIYSILIDEQVYYSSKINQLDIPEDDRMYADTIEHVNNTRLKLRSMISQVRLIDIDGLAINTFTYDLDANTISIDAVANSDLALLKLEEVLWNIHWVDGVTLDAGGPGAIGAVISFSVGEDNEE